MPGHWAQQIFAILEKGIPKVFNRNGVGWDEAREIHENNWQTCSMKEVDEDRESGIVIYYAHC